MRSSLAHIAAPFRSLAVRFAAVAFCAAAAFAIDAVLAAQSLPIDAAASTSATSVEATPVSAVIELFTSQGCSSCPPADALFKTYVDRKDIVALSLPVDYWDYLGWKDTLASPKNSERQRTYAKARGDGAVYTPQVVVNGLAHAVGSDASAIERQIARTTMEFERRRVAMRFWRASNTLVVEIAAAPAGSKPGEATIWVAAVQREAEVMITKGENHGHTLKYYNVVEALTPVGMWTGQETRLQLASQTFMRPGTYRYAVLMQHGAAGPIIGAAWLGG
jgi:hypothetical protein